MLNKLLVKKLDANAKLPERAHGTDAGYDLFSCEEAHLQPGETRLINTGIAIKMERQDDISENRHAYVGLLWDRSSLGSKGMHRFGGVIDEGYRGPIKVALYNSTDEVYSVYVGAKIAQLLLQKVFIPAVEEVEELDETERGDAGFGSTGA